MPIGRSGSCSPARERRSALETAATASSWPMTRWCRRSSMWMSFSTSPSSRRETGILVQRATTSAMSSALTTSAGSPRRAVACAPRARRACARARGSRRGAARAAASRLASRSARSSSTVACSRRSRDLLHAADRVLLGLPLGGHRRPTARLRSAARGRACRGARARRRRPPWPARCARSPAAGCGARPRRSRPARSRSRCAGRDAASSIRSMALSGRKRSAM